MAEGGVSGFETQIYKKIEKEVEEIEQINTVSFATAPITSSDEEEEEQTPLTPGDKETTPSPKKRDDVWARAESTPKKVIYDPELNTSVRSQLIGLQLDTEERLKEEEILKRRDLTSIKETDTFTEDVDSPQAEEEEEDLQPPHEHKTMVEGIFQILTVLMANSDDQRKEIEALKEKVDKFTEPAQLLPRLVTECGSLGKQIRSIEVRLEKQTASLSKLGQDLAVQMAGVIRNTAFRKDLASEGFIAYSAPQKAPQEAFKDMPSTSKPEESLPGLSPSTAPPRVGRIVPMSKTKINARLVKVAVESNTMLLLPSILSRLSKVPAEEAEAQLQEYEKTGTLQKKK